MTENKEGQISTVRFILADKSTFIKMCYAEINIKKVTKTKKVTGDKRLW